MDIDEISRSTPMDIDKPAGKNGEQITAKREPEKKDDIENTEGLTCPICMDSWTATGEHQVCCLPCGHLFGTSCLKRWLNQRGGWRSKCPQCRSLCKVSDIRLLYASRIVAVDDDHDKQELQKKVQSLESRCAYLEKKDSEWCRKEWEWRMTSMGFGQARTTRQF
ncbi:OLC1v1031804C1 [Oldenlandia corymbosa var. corymbosa]|uniref:OLC1v1031804C1 n=1 Tax=Oldenlandia corymbosa var. corymbosa TaxID=529605 RepID=A0AAV1CJD9_OLDCO|nr:OLC1v1031804C1 [Oldenlandia corymbosa var. corymbosa]